MARSQASSRGTWRSAAERRRSASKTPALRRGWRPLTWAFRLGCAFLVVSVAWAAVYGVIPPPVTPLMLIRGAERSYTWQPLDRISPHLVHAVIAAEDGGFCDHNGFDWDAIEAALKHNEAGRSLRGGSTISQQTAKNAFLWPDRSWLRKGLEAWFTLLIEALWSKRRILETYLNIVEWADGIYGAEAAARHHFGRSAERLSRRQAALLAAVLPNPRTFSASRPSRTVNRRAGILDQRAVFAARTRLAACTDA